MLSEAKPALKPDIREAKGNPNRGHSQQKTTRLINRVVFIFRNNNNYWMIVILPWGSAYCAPMTPPRTSVMYSIRTSSIGRLVSNCSAALANA